MLPQGMQLTDVLRVPSLSIHPRVGWGMQRVTRQWAGAGPFPPSRDHSVGRLCARVPVWTERDNLRLFSHPSQFTGVRSAFLSAGSSCSLLLLLFAVHRCVCVCVC